MITIGQEASRALNTEIDVSDLVISLIRDLSFEFAGGRGGDRG